MFAQADANNFYASCETIFRPDLRVRQSEVEQTFALTQYFTMYQSTLIIHSRMAMSAFRS
ncbi:hypothetical protein FHW11_004653 [Pantoea agglomerans]|nr:hypothetical protein [Pantoea agglomerans]MBA8894557.1 hypothetical protein [Pantoea agglomerans]